MSDLTDEQKEEALAYYKKIYDELVERLASIDLKKIDNEIRGVIVSPDYSQIDVLEVHTYQNENRKDTERDI